MQGRQPSGANAPRPQQGAMPRMPGVANRAGVPKAPSLGKTPSDMGIYGAPGSANRNNAIDAYQSNTGPDISRGPHTPDPNANPKDNMQLLSGSNANPNINLQEMFYGKGSRANALDAQDAAMAPKPRSQAPDPRAYMADGIARPNDPIPMGNLGPGISDSMARKGDYTGNDYLEQATAKPYSYMDQVQAERKDREAKQQARASGQLDDVAKSVEEMGLLEANVPPELVQKYKENLASGKTKMTPQEAVAYYQAYYQAPAVAQGAAQGLRAQGDAKLAAAQEYATGVDQLKDVGVKNYGDYNYKTNLQNQTTEARNASLEAELKRQEGGGGLKYREASTGFGTREQGAQAAADFRNMGAADQARNQRIKDESERLYASTRAERDARNAAQVEQGLNPEQVQKGTSKLTSEFTAITKQGVAPGLKFTDYVQQQIDSGRTDISPDAISVIEKNYGVQFNKSPSQQSGPSIQGPSLIDLARQKAADARDARGMEEAQQQGRERRREQAAAQAAYRSDAARLIGQGMSPQQAHQALARDQATKDFYDANVAMQSAEAQGQIGAAGLQAQADMYRSNMQFLDNSADRKEKSAQRLYDQQQAENQAMMQIEQQASQLPGDPRDPNTPAGRYAATQRALRLGVQPPNPIQAAKDTPADQRTSSQTNSLVDTSIEQLKASQGFDPNSNTAIITGVRKFKEAGLSPQEQIKGISKLTGQDMSIKSNSTKAIRAIMEDISTRATANSQNSLTGKDYAREFTSGAADYVEALRALKEGSGMSDQEFAAILKENPIGQYLNQQQGRGLTGAAFGPFLGPIIDSFL